MSDKMMFCWRNVFSRVVNTAFHMLSREKFWDKRVFLQKKMFDILFCFWMKKFRICGRSFQQGCQKQNPRDQRNFLVKLHLEEDTTLCLLMVVLRKTWFAKKSRFVSKAFNASSGTFYGTKSWKKQNLSNFWAVSENVLGFWHNGVGRVAKTAFHVTRATFGLNWTFFQKNCTFNTSPDF